MYIAKKDKDLEFSIIDSLTNMVFVIDPTGIIIHMNKSVKSILQADNIVNDVKSIYDILKCYQIFDNNELVAFIDEKAFMQNLYLNNGIKNKVYKCKRTDKTIFLSVNVCVISSDGEINRFVINVNDVTDNYLRELQLKEERERFIKISTELNAKCDIIEILRNREKDHLMHLKDVINNISEGLLVLDNKGKFNFCNNVVYSMLGINPGEIIHYTNILKSYQITPLDKNKSDLKTLFTLNNIIDSTVLFMKSKMNGEEKYVEYNVNPIYNKKKELLYTIMTLKDVTEIKEHELNAEEQANFIKNVVDTMDIPIAVINYPEKRIKLINKNFEYIINSTVGDSIKKADLINKSIEDILRKGRGKELLSALEYCCINEKEFTYTPFKITDQEGEEKYYKLKYKPCKDINGKTNIIHIQAMDITDETINNIELKKVTNLKDEFFTVISHELRTPLTIIYSSLQLATNIYRDEITSNISKTFSRIGQNCSRLLKLINNILDISKAEAGFLLLNPCSFDIITNTEAIVNSVNYYAISKGIDLIFDTNEEEMEVQIDRDKYEKILLNLLSNAIKFTAKGKQIIVAIDIQKDFITLSVKDEGVGIPKDKFNAIFDRFAQVNNTLSRRSEGTGLGLSLVKCLVELMDGSINVNSKVGVGSEFLVSFRNIPVQLDVYNNYSMMDVNFNDKIDIEFSDIN